MLDLLPDLLPSPPYPSAFCSCLQIRKGKWEAPLTPPVPFFFTVHMGGRSEHLTLVSSTPTKSLPQPHLTQQQVFPTWMSSLYHEMLSVSLRGAGISFFSFAFRLKTELPKPFLGEALLLSQQSYLGLNSPEPCKFCCIRFPFVFLGCSPPPAPQHWAFIPLSWKQLPRETHNVHKSDQLVYLCFVES